MAKRGRSRHPVVRWLEWAAVVVLGVLFGSALGALAGALLPKGRALQAILRTWPLGVSPPLTLDLVVVQLTLGFTVHVGLVSLLGLLAAVLLYLRWR